MHIDLVLACVLSQLWPQLASLSTYYAFLRFAIRPVFFREKWWFAELLVLECVSLAALWTKNNAIRLIFEITWRYISRSGVRDKWHVGYTTHISKKWCLLLLYGTRDCSSVCSCVHLGCARVVKLTCYRIRNICGLDWTDYLATIVSYLLKYSAQVLVIDGHRWDLLFT